MECTWYTIPKGDFAMKKILVVEDDLILNKTLCYNLRNSGYQVHSANTAGAAVKEAAAHFDLVVLDVNLPDGSGFDLCRRIKAANPAPAVIFLTARDMEEDMLSGFELGADDYVTKPFPISVLQKKIEILLQKNPHRTTDEIYDDGVLYINFSETSATLSGIPITFTATEYRILRLMTANSGIVLTRQVLLEKLWDVNENFVDEHALTSAISRIRSKLEKSGGQYIKTVYGMGYMWIGGLKK